MIPKDPKWLAKAEELAGSLVVNGLGNVAERLVLMAGGRDLGGWCREAIRDRLALALEEAHAEGQQKEREKMAGKVFDAADAMIVPVRKVWEGEVALWKQRAEASHAAPKRVPCSCGKDTASMKWAKCYSCRQAADAEAHAAGKAEGQEEERARFVAAHESAAESIPECPPEVIDGWLARELADYKMVIDHCTAVYCHVTRDRVSKPQTLPSVVIAIADDFATEDYDEAYAEGKAEGRREGIEDAIMEVMHVYPITIRSAVEAIRALFPKASSD